MGKGKGGKKKGKKHNDGAPAGSIIAKRKACRPEAIESAIAGGYNVPDRAWIQLSPRNTRIITGQEDLSEWDNEELRRGQKRDKNGKWQGRKPKTVPTALHDELTRRTIIDAKRLMRNAMIPACEMLAEVIKDEKASPRDRIKAATIILDRIMGKTPDQVEIKNTEADLPWLNAISESIITIPESKD